MSDIFGFGFVMREKGEETNRKGDAKDIISCCMGLSKNPSHEITPGLFFCEIKTHAALICFVLLI